LDQNKREGKRRTKFQMNNVMIREEDLERGKGRGRWQRKTVCVVMVPCSSEYLHSHPTKTTLSLYV